MAGRLSRGDVVLVKFPPPDKERPVLVLTRESMLSTLARVTVAPITSTVRGALSEVVLTADDGMKQTCAVNLHNVTTVPRRILGRRVASLGPLRMEQVCVALAFALGCEGP